MRGAAVPPPAGWRRAGCRGGEAASPRAAAPPGTPPPVRPASGRWPGRWSARGSRCPAASKKAGRVAGRTEHKIPAVLMGAQPAERGDDRAQRQRPHAFGRPALQEVELGGRRSRVFPGRSGRWRWGPAAGCRARWASPARPCRPPPAAGRWCCAHGRPPFCPAGSNPPLRGVMCSLRALTWLCSTSA